MEVELSVDRIPAKIAKPFVIEHHYSGGIHNGPMTWGLHENGELVGVCAFATPSSENVRSSVFGPEYKKHVTELHRLVILDRMPRNTASWFIVRALKGLKDERPYYWAVLSYADTAEGHAGIIYQATNAMYCGMSGSARFWRDETGRIRHPRQNGVNVNAAEGKRRGWTPVKRPGKHRYLYLLPDNRRHKKELLSMLRLEREPYPKDDE